MRKYHFILLVFFSLQVFSQAEVLESQLIPMDPGVKTGILANGLTYYIKKNSEPKERAELYLVIKAGSLQENEEQLGLAHFLEHMAFNGTRSFPKNELIDYLQRAGIRFGADLNAYTGFEETVYQLPLPTDDPELFASGFKILSEWAGGITLSEEEIDLERGIIVAEERQRGKNMNERISKQLLPVLFAGSRYKDRLPIGEMEVIQNFNYPTLEEFYKDWYRPDLQAVIAVGDFDVDEVENLIRENFSALTSPSEKPEKKEYYIPANKEPLVKIVTDPEFPYTVASIIYKHPETVTKTTEDFRNSIIRSAVSSMLSSRIGELTQSGNAPFLQAGANYGAFQGGMVNLDAFSLQVVAKTPQTLHEAIDGLMDEVHKATRYGFTSSELERVKTNFLASVEKSYKEKDKTASKTYVNQLLKHFTEGEAVMDMEYSLDFYNKYLDGISLEEVNEMIKSFVTPENQIIMVQAAESSREVLPNEDTLVQWVNNPNREVEAYVDNFSEEDLVNDQLGRSEVVERKSFKSIGATELVLANGIKVVLKPTDFKNDQILFTAFSPGGYSLTKPEDIHSSTIASDIIASSGIGDFSSVQVSKLLTGKSLSVSPYIGTYSEGIKGYSSPEDLKTALEVIYLYFQHPRKDSVQFRRLIENYKVAIEGKASNPMAVFQDSVNAVMRGTGPYAVSPDVEEIEKISLDTAYEFYKDRFENAGDFTFLFVGNFEPDSITPLLETYLGSLPVNGKKETYRDVGIRPVTGKIEKTVYKGLEDKSVVVLAYHDKFKYKPQNKLYLKAIESALDTKVMERLREGESGVYSPSVSLSYVRKPNPYYTLSVSFSCATDRVEELIEATQEEIEKMKEEGPTADDLKKFVEQEKNQKETQLRSNGYWLNYLENVYSGDTEMEYLENYEKDLESLNIKDLKKAAKKFLETDNFSQLILKPENAV